MGFVIAFIGFVVALGAAIYGIFWNIERKDELKKNETRVKAVTWHNAELAKPRFFVRVFSNPETMIDGRRMTTTYDHPAEEPSYKLRSSMYSGWYYEGMTSKEHALHLAESIISQKRYSNGKQFVPIHNITRIEVVEKAE